MNELTIKLKHYIDPSKYKRIFKYIKNRTQGVLNQETHLIFKGWDIQFPKIKFIYCTNDTDYYCYFNINSLSYTEFENIDKDLLKHMLSVIGLSFSPRFFALNDFTEIRSTISLTQDVINFFETSIPLSLAEYRYREGLDPTRPLKIISAVDTHELPLAKESGFTNKLLLLNGGGKDTVVMVEICKTLDIELAWFAVNLKDSQKKIAESSGINTQYDVDISYDKNISRDSKYEIHSLPYLMSYNILAFPLAVARGYSYISSGNEASSNFGNITYKGMDINHQYTKSFEFERLLSELAKKHISPAFHNFSLLRPFHDIQLGKYYSRHNQYFGSIVSCNIDPINWCKKCAKCAFTYIALMPFVREDDMNRIFGSNFLLDRDIRREVVELTTKSLKPWECVGTKEECKLVLFMILQKYPDLDFDSWPTRIDLEECCKDIDLEETKSEYLESFNETNLIPGHIVQILKLQYLKTH